MEWLTYTYEEKDMKTSADDYEYLYEADKEDFEMLEEMKGSIMDHFWYGVASYGDEPYKNCTYS